MKKELIMAVVAGLILGLIITAGIYTANRSLNNQKAQKQLQLIPSPSLQPAANKEKNINLTAPEANDLVSEPELIINGIAWPGAVVAIIAETATSLTAADNEGIFSFKIELIKGFNEITLIASDDTGTAQTLNFILTYSTAIIELGRAPALAAPVYAAEATAGAETVTEKIKERLQNTAGEEIISIKEALTEKSREPRKKAYIGQISAQDETSLTLTYKDQVYSVNLKPETGYYKGTSQPLASEDLKINDFVIAMGFYYPESNSFTAERVSVVSKPEPSPAKQLITGKITEVDGQKISFNGKSVALTAKTKLAVSGLEEAETEDLVLGDILFAIVTLNDNGNISSVNNVFVLPGKDNPASQIPTNINATDSGEVTTSAADDE